MSKILIEPVWTSEYVQIDETKLVSLTAINTEDLPSIEQIAEMLDGCIVEDRYEGQPTVMLDIDGTCYDYS